MLYMYGGDDGETKVKQLNIKMNELIVDSDNNQANSKSNLFKSYKDCILARKYVYMIETWEKQELIYC